MYRALLFALAAAGSIGAATPATPPNPDQIIRKSVDAIKSDWEQAPKYSYLERDLESKGHSPQMAKTYRVLMIDGSPYNFVTAINDLPLVPGDQAEEQRKLQREIEKEAEGVRSRTSKTDRQVRPGAHARP